MREAWAPRRGGGAQELKVRSQQYRSGRKSGRCEKSSQKVMMETVACRASCAWALAASDSTRPAASARAPECTVGAPKPDAAARPAESVSDRGRPRWCGGYVPLAGEPGVRCGRCPAQPVCTASASGTTSGSIAGGRKTPDGARVHRSWNNPEKQCSRYRTDLSIQL